MPKIVDHDQRRHQIVEAFLAIVARDGLPAATSRAVAAELGMGTGALWHYFDGFDEVASGAYQQIVERTNGRITAAVRGLRGLEAVHAMLREILPLVKETQDEASVVVGFWGRLASNEKMDATQSDIADEWTAQFRGYFTEAIEDGELDPATPLDDVIDVLLAIGFGQQVFAMMHAPIADPARQLQLVDHVLLPWRLPKRR
ncbi:TetR family transcriptional regulator C-terminal domain-containing protein [Actinoplanes sp. NPDC051851]|uniref:TetR/AcrR family transcriptional regulator n=1 Tax=Actinoplanes sp. NPDC051851 TaxID=3154753 RepID=UPI00341D7747